LAEHVVRRPVRLVERAPGGRDRPAHVLVAAVGHLAENLFGGRVDVVELLARLRIDEGTVDEHPPLRLEGACFGLDHFPHSSTGAVTRALTTRSPVTSRKRSSVPWTVRELQKRAGVHPDLLAGDVAGLVRREEEHKV